MPNFHVAQRAPHAAAPPFPSIELEADGIAFICLC
jgi:hypothetical protein